MPQNYKSYKPVQFFTKQFVRYFYCKTYFYHVLLIDNELENYLSYRRDLFINMTLNKLYPRTKLGDLLTTENLHLFNHDWNLCYYVNE